MEIRAADASDRDACPELRPLRVRRADSRPWLRLDEDARYQIGGRPRLGAKLVGVPV
jgi:hypothetical protein